MRIALLHPTYWPEVRRGSERLVHDLGAELVARGHRVTLLTSHRAPPRHTIEDGIEVVRSWRPPRPPGFALHEYHVENVPAVLWRLLTGRFDVAHAFFPSDAWAAVRAQRFGGPPVVASLHGIPIRQYLVARRYRLDMLQEIVGRAGECIVLSEAAARPFRNYLLREPRIVPAGVHTGSFAVKVPRDRSPTVLFPASLGDPRKRGPLLFEALELLRGRGHAVRALVLHTPDPVMSRQQLRLPARAEWVQAHATEDLATLYARAWATVLPAAEEAFGIALVESLAAGTPVVAARSGAGPEIVDREEVGELFEPDRAGELARAIERVIERAGAGASAEACRSRALEFDWSEVAPRYEAVYRSVVESTSSGSPGERSSAGSRFRRSRTT